MTHIISKCRLTILCLILAIGFASPSQASFKGKILVQSLDSEGNGYTVMKVWGTYYEMGYAHGYLLADDIDAIIISFKAAVGSNYNLLKSQMQNTVIPSDMTEEINGIVAGVKAVKPSSLVDSGDLIILNTYADWAYAPNCRSHSCWGSYVIPPVKTLSTRRTDYSSSDINKIFNFINVLFLAYEPSENGKIRWASLGMPGVIVAATAVNEYGTLISIHDSPDSVGSHATGANVMTRTIATRYMITLDNLPADISEQVDYVYSALQDYQAWTGAYLNYYAPMGNSGVISCSASEGFYNLRKPQPSYYGGDVLVTSNKPTDGTFTPPDASIFNSYYDDSTPKTLDDHWGLLDSVGPRFGAQQLSVEYRDKADMTIWFRGRLQDLSTTPIIKLEWSDLFGLRRPFNPAIMPWNTLLLLDD